MNYFQQFLHWVETRPKFVPVEPEGAVFLVLISFLFFYWLQFVSKVIFDFFYVPSCFKTLEDKMDWHSRIVSTIHATMAAVLAGYVLFSDWNAIMKSICGYWTDNCSIVLALTAGYLLSDFWVVFNQRDYLMMLHHLGGAFGLFMSLVNKIF
jgi:hypothetical protein